MGGNTRAYSKEEEEEEEEEEDTRLWSLQIPKIPFWHPPIPQVRIQPPLTPTETTLQIAIPAPTIPQNPFLALSQSLKTSTQIPILVSPTPPKTPPQNPLLALSQSPKTPPPNPPSGLSHSPKIPLLALPLPGRTPPQIPPLAPPTPRKTTPTPQIPLLAPSYYPKSLFCFLPLPKDPSSNPPSGPLQLFERLLPLLKSPFWPPPTLRKTSPTPQIPLLAPSNSPKSLFCLFPLPKDPSSNPPSGPLQLP
ncbi:uncharacterized protein [Palaemon carinicauda]|uniref:uncharacterized protein n=1 Tax=Palaemon carinicauda TaxID=392227 RepID=UPI0035B5D13E